MDEKKAEKSPEEPASSASSGPSRSLRLSKLDSQGARAMWRDSAEKSSAEEVVGKMEGAFETIIRCLGDPKPERDGLKRTPKRAAHALCYFTKGYEEDLKSTVKSIVKIFMVISSF